MPQRFIETCNTELVSKYTIVLEYMENGYGEWGTPKRGTPKRGIGGGLGDRRVLSMERETDGEGVLVNHYSHTLFQLSMNGSVMK